MSWDIFCKVIDNYGDIGVCWRLACTLAARGKAVRLWIDEPSALAWMAPQGAPGVRVIAWTHPAPDLPPADVVIEAFGCEPPAAYVTRMKDRGAHGLVHLLAPTTASRPAPVWINLEYLSAEAYVERSHGLMSPQFSGPGAGLKKWFFYPGFTPATGGLLRAQNAASPPRSASVAWAQGQGWAAHASEQAVTVFCYANPVLPALIRALASLQPTLLLVPPGPAVAQVQGLMRDWTASKSLPVGLRVINLPYLSQPDFDQLLASADLNLVRGEDSFVQAQCNSDAPFLWQIYPQHDGAHLAKLEAFLALYLASCPPDLALAVGACFRAYNGLAPWPAALPEHGAWRAVHRRWRDKLGEQTDLGSQLIEFVAERRLK